MTSIFSRLHRDRIFHVLTSIGLGLCAAGLAACDRSTQNTDKPKIGAILMQQDQFFRLNESGMRTAAEKLGVDLRVQNAAGALDKEISLIETFMAQRVGAILVSPLSAAASLPALKRASETGIRIITYNNSLPAAFVSTEIGSDQVELGASSGEAARQYVSKHRAGKARIAIIGFASQLPEQGGARVAGFKQAVTGLPGVEIVAEQDAWEAPQAATVVGELLTKNPDIIWAANEGGTVGAVTAVKNAGKGGRVVVFGTDISVQLIDFLLSDDGILQAVTAQQPYEMGSAAVEAAARALRAEPIQKKQVMNGRLFTRDQPDELRSFRDRLAGASR